MSLQAQVFQKLFKAMPPEKVKDWQSKNPNFKLRGSSPTQLRAMPTIPKKSFGQHLKAAGGGLLSIAAKAFGGGAVGSAASNLVSMGQAVSATGGGFLPTMGAAPSVNLVGASPVSGEMSSNIFGFGSKEREEKTARLKFISAVLGVVTIVIGIVVAVIKRK